MATFQNKLYCMILGLALLGVSCGEDLPIQEVSLSTISVALDEQSCLPATQGCLFFGESRISVNVEPRAFSETTTRTLSILRSGTKTSLLENLKPGDFVNATLCLTPTACVEFTEADCPIIERYGFVFEVLDDGSPGIGAPIGEHPTGNVEEGCADTAVDAGVGSDAGVNEDASTVDDVGTGVEPDVGLGDAGVAVDAGSDASLQIEDAGATDTSVDDASVSADIGTEDASLDPDVGIEDASLDLDVGTQIDVGSDDASLDIDAGADAGVDSGIGLVDAGTSASIVSSVVVSLFEGSCLPQVRRACLYLPFNNPIDVTILPSEFPSRRTLQFAEPIDTSEVIVDVVPGGNVLGSLCTAPDACLELSEFQCSNIDRYWFDFQYQRDGSLSRGFANSEFIGRTGELCDFLTPVE